MANPRRPRPKLTQVEKLRIARAELRGMRHVIASGEFTVSGGAPVAVPIPDSGRPPRFIQCWAVGRGYAAVTQALDELGQVWERVSILEKDSSTNAKVLKESYWIKLDMTRKG